MKYISHLLFYNGIFQEGGGVAGEDGGRRKQHICHIAGCNKVLTNFSVRSRKKLTFCNPMLKTKYGTFPIFWNCFATGVWEDFAFEGTPPMAQWRKAFCVQLGFLWKKIHQVQTVNYCFEALLKLDFPGLMNCRGIGALTLGKSGSNVPSARRSS